MNKTYSFDDILEVEQSLNEANVFINGISGRPAHPDSYMTIADFGSLEQWSKEKKFSNEQLQFCIDYWNGNCNCGLALRVAGAMINFWR